MDTTAPSWKEHAARLDVLEKHATNGGRGFAGELSPAVGSVPKWSTCFALAGDLTNSEQRTALDEIATLCRWDLAECHLLRVPGVKWPPPAHVPAETCLQAGPL